MAATLSVAAVSAVLPALEKVNWSAIGKAFQEQAANLPDDASALEALVEAVAAVGLISNPVAIEAELGIAVAAEIVSVVLTYGSQDKSGALAPPWAGGTAARGSDPN